MPFGARRFQKLVNENGQLLAYFLPLDLGGAAEFEDEDTLLAKLASEAGVLYPEEELARKAFKAASRQKAFSRSAVEAATVRGQHVMVDVLDPRERKIVERWRHILSRAKLPPRAATQDGTADPGRSSKQEFLDASRDVLALVDHYFPRPKGT